jgi:hypothetical protein
MLKHLFANNRPGFYQGKHYTDYVDHVKALKRDQRRLAEAEELLLGLIDAVEAEALAKQVAMAPWYTEQLAIIYHEQRRYAAELALLERYDRAARTPMFADRIVRTKANLTNL